MPVPDADLRGLSFAAKVEMLKADPDPELDPEPNIWDSTPECFDGTRLAYGRLIKTRGHARFDPRPEFEQDESKYLIASLTPVRGGYIIRRTDEYVIEVIQMLFNWRLYVALPEHYGQVYEHGFCYYGTGPDPFILAVKAGQQWRDPLNTDPVGFSKKAF